MRNVSIIAPNDLPFNNICNSYLKNLITSNHHSDVSHTWPFSTNWSMPINYILIIQKNQQWDIRPSLKNCLLGVTQPVII